MEAVVGERWKLEQEFAQMLEQHAIPFSELFALRTKDDFFYLSDPHTYEMLFISVADRAQLNPAWRDYEGRKCYEVLQGRDAPCPFCTNHLLKKERYHVWQHYNEVAGGNYILKDKLVNWHGKDVRMEVVMDITDSDRMRAILIESMESQNLLMECNQILAETEAFDAALQKLLKLVCEYFGAGSGLSIIYEDISTFAIWPPKEVLPYLKIMPDQETVQQWSALLQGKAQVYIPSLDTMELGKELKQICLARNVHALNLTPIYWQEHLVGFFILTNISANQNQLSTLELMMAAISRKISAIQLQKENWRLQHVDALTGHLNFVGYKQEVAKLLSQNTGRSYAVWYCDIKQFKYINDVYGYSAGDSFLKFWADWFAQKIRPGETFCRVSADNMTAFLYYDHVEELRWRFAEMAETLHDYRPLSGRQFSVEVVVGIYLLEDKDNFIDLSTMLDRANIAQKSVKCLSGSQVAFFSEELRQKHVREMKITQQLPQAIAEGQLEIYFQPQYHYTSGQMTGAEALVRWTHPELGRLSPAEFIPILEQSGQIMQLDRYVWEQACGYLQKWRKSDRRLMDFSVSVNVSRRDIYMPDFCDLLEALVKCYELPPAALHLEITESAYMENPQQLIKVTEQLQQKGFQVEMDDFGSGYSSLNILKDVPVDLLKLDMCFLTGSYNSQRGSNILSSVVRMARWLKIPVLVEGVEQKEQAAYLESIGCDLMQGYYFSKPLPAAEFEALLRGTAVGEVGKQYEDVDLLDAYSFLDPADQTSYIFNYCIGAAGVVEYANGQAEALLLNDQYFAVLGICREEKKYWSYSLYSCVAAEDWAVCVDCMEESVRIGQTSCEVRIVNEHTEETFWVRIAFHRLVASGQYHLLFLLLENIDAYKQAETNQLFENYGKRMTAIFDEVYDADYSRDVVTLIHSSQEDPTVGRIRHGAAQDAAAWVLKNEIQEAEAFLAFSGRENVQRAYHNHEMPSIRLQFGTNGAVRWRENIMFPLTKDRALFCIRDISSEKRAEQAAMKAAEHRTMQMLARSLPAGVVVVEWDAVSKPHLTFVSEAACKLLAVTVQELQTELERIRDQTQEKLPMFSSKEIMQALEEERPIEQWFAMKRADGKTLQLHCLISLFPQEKEKRLVCIMILDSEMSQCREKKIPDLEVDR